MLYGVAMNRVQIMYEIGGVMATDVAVAERLNVRLKGGHATIKTGRQSAMYAQPARILIDHGVEADPQPITRSDIATDRSTNA